jgi:hypothetical protein
MRMWIAQNKYKLMVAIIGLYLVADAGLHKGQARVLFPKNFPESTNAVLEPYSSSLLMNKDKNWKKAINTKERMGKLCTGEPGFECDVYFNTSLKSFDVHHDPGKSIGFSLDDLLQIYRQKNLTASIWLDIKNLNDSNAVSALHSLVELRNRYYLPNRILVESPRADLLTAFSDSGFYTSYYVPFFNPYQMSTITTKFWVDSITSVIVKSKINALSGYYFQCGFLKHYFSTYPVLTWIKQSPGSLVNCLFQMKLNADESIFIVLKS